MSEELEQFPVSLELLRVMFSFVGLLGKPNSTTIQEFFSLGWELENRNSVTLRFKSESVIDYVIFKPENPLSKTGKRIILNGSMSSTELIQYLKDNIWY